MERPTNMTSWVSWPLPSGHVMMASFLFSQMLDALAMTFFSDEKSWAMRRYIIWTPDFEPFVVQAAVVYVKFEDQRSAPDHMLGFRLLFTFHEVLLYYV